MYSHPHALVYFLYILYGLNYLNYLLSTWLQFTNFPEQSGLTELSVIMECHKSTSYYDFIIIIWLKITTKSSEFWIKLGLLEQNIVCFDQGTNLGLNAPFFGPGGNVQSNKTLSHKQISYMFFEPCKYIHYNCHIPIPLQYLKKLYTTYSIAKFTLTNKNVLAYQSTLFSESCEL